MSISIDSSSVYNNTLMAGTNKKTDSLEKNLGNIDIENAADEELLEACKDFETYFVEQVFKEMRKTVHSSDEDNEYISQFGDMLYEKYSENITESGSLGIAQMLYESMKRNSI